LNHILRWTVALIFCSFAAVNLNDPDGFIWVPVYLAVAFLPFTKIGSEQTIKISAVVLLIIGILVTRGLMNTIMPWQLDNRMVNLWEHQREGLGLILGAAWLWFGHRLK